MYSSQSSQSISVLESLVWPFSRGDIPEDCWRTNSKGNRYCSFPDGIRFAYWNADDSFYYHPGAPNDAYPSLAAGKPVYITPDGYEHTTLRTSEDGHLYTRLHRETGIDQLRWKDADGTIYRDPEPDLLPKSLGGNRDAKVWGFRMGRDGWEFFRLAKHDNRDDDDSDVGPLDVTVAIKLEPQSLPKIGAINDPSQERRDQPVANHMPAGQLTVVIKKEIQDEDENITRIKEFENPVSNGGLNGSGRVYHSPKSTSGVFEKRTQISPTNRDSGRISKTTLPTKRENSRLTFGVSKLLSGNAKTPHPTPPSSQD